MVKRGAAAAGRPPRVLGRQGLPQAPLPAAENPTPGRGRRRPGLSPLRRGEAGRACPGGGSPGTFVHLVAMDCASEDLTLLPVASPDVDRPLIRAFMAGERGAAAVLDEWIELVLRTDFRVLEAEWPDLRQEIRVRVLGNLRAGRFKGGSSLRTYVHRIAKNTAIDYWRAFRRRREETGIGAATSLRKDPSASALSRVISKDLLRKILSELDPDERRLLDMVHAQHMSYSEIACLLGVAEGTVKARVFRCRERMLSSRRRLLEEAGA